MRLLKDALARRAMGLVAALPAVLVLLIVVGLFLKSKAIVAVEPLSRLLFSSAWHPLKGEFGLLPFIAGTVWVTVTALVLAVPVSIFAAIYLSEYAPRWVRESAKPVVDLLAGLPSVVYGVWGVILVVPFVGERPRPARRRLFVGLQHPRRRHRPGHHDLPDDHPRDPRGLRLRAARRSATPPSLSARRNGRRRGTSS